MRFSTSAAAAVTVVASLLVRDVLGAVHNGHRHFHAVKAARAPVVTVTEDDMAIVTATVYVTVDPDQATSMVDAVAVTSSATSSDEATSTTLIHTTLYGTITVGSAAAASVVPIAESAVLPTTTPAAVLNITSTSSSVVPESTTSSAAASVNLDAGQVFQHQQSTTSTTRTTSSTSTTSTTSQKVIPTTMATVVKPTTTSISAAAATSSTAPVTSGSKRGLPYNTASVVPSFLATGHISWAYNWGDASSGLTSAVEYVPMLWGLGSHTNGWTDAANAALASGSTHLLSFNEPDLAAQSNLDVGSAAAGYLQYMQPFAGKAKLGSPAVTNGGGSMGLTYLSSFISACSSCTIDFVAIHWYDSASNIAYFKSHVADAYTAGGNRPVWITEFGASGSDADVAAFLAEAIPWLESISYVQRYAYFMAGDGTMMTGTTLNAVGTAFIS